MRKMPEMDRGIRGHHFREMMGLIYDMMEDDVIYDHPIFELLYIILRKIVGTSSDATARHAETKEA
jgi:hypothetical protein